MELVLNTGVYDPSAIQTFSSLVQKKYVRNLVEEFVMCLLASEFITQILGAEIREREGIPDFTIFDVSIIVEELSWDKICFKL